MLYNPIIGAKLIQVLTFIFPSAPVVQGWTTTCDWLEAPLLGHSPCHRFIESCPQGVLRTIRVVIQPESSGWTFTCCHCKRTCQSCIGLISHKRACRKRGHLQHDLHYRSKVMMIRCEHVCLCTNNNVIEAVDKIYNFSLKNIMRDEHQS